MRMIFLLFDSLNRRALEGDPPMPRGGFEHAVTDLYDTETPGQMTPVQEPEVERHLIEQMLALINAHDTLPEGDARLDVAARA